MRLAIAGFRYGEENRMLSQTTASMKTFQTLKK